MSKIRQFCWGSYRYFDHCPFCGSVAVDYKDKTFRCPDCGAVVTFDVQRNEEICDGPTDDELIIGRWNNRPSEEITADDLCVMAQKTEREMLIVYKEEIQDKIWEYVIDSATIGKYECELPKEFASPDFYKKKGFNVTEKEKSFIVSWKKDIKWDNE